MSVTAETPCAPGPGAVLAELAALGQAATDLLAEITEHLAQLGRPAAS